MRLVQKYLQVPLVQGRSLFFEEEWHRRQSRTMNPRILKHSLNRNGLLSTTSIRQCSHTDDESFLPVRHFGLIMAHTLSETLADQSKPNSSMDGIRKDKERDHAETTENQRWAGRKLFRTGCTSFAEVKLQQSDWKWKVSSRTPCVLPSLSTVQGPMTRSWIFRSLFWYPRYKHLRGYVPQSASPQRQRGH